MLGTIQKMRVIRTNEKSYVLEKNGIEVQLDREAADKGLTPGVTIDVFIHTDRHANYIASARLPHIQMDMYGWAEVVDIKQDLGVFVDIGMDKDLLVSLDNLPLYTAVWPQIGDWLYVTLGADKNNRLLAVPATDDTIYSRRTLAPDEQFNQPISGRIHFTDKEGAAVYTDEGFRGFIHHTQRKEKQRLGERIHGRVIEVKEDGSLNISLLPYKSEARLEDADTILTYIQYKGGRIPFDDKSDPDDIMQTFRISKAAFKRALGKLMKEGKVEQQDGYTLLKD